MSVTLILSELLRSLNDFLFNDTATTVIYTLSLHDALPIYVTTKYTVDSTDTEQRFIITDNRADTTTLNVTVQKIGRAHV